MAEQTVLQTLLSQISQTIVKKLEKGKKLSTEEILLLYLDLLHNELREMRRELGERANVLDRRVDETNKRIDHIRLELSNKIDEVNKRIDDNNKRIDNIYMELSKRLNTIHLELSRKIDEINKRMDRLYELMLERKEGEKGIP